MSPASVETVEELQRAGLLEPVEAGDGLTYPKSGREIHFSVSLRAAGHETYQILNEQRLEIGTIEPPNVYREAHPGAIYQHSDDSYRVTYLDRERRIVRVRPEALPHYTRANSTSTLRVEQVYASQQLALGAWPVEVTLGDVLVQETIVGYQELTLAANEMVRRVNLDYPLTITLHTTAMWVLVPPALISTLALPAAQSTPADGSDETDTGPADPFSAGLHAIEHLLTGVLPLLVMCDRRDIDGYYHVQHPDLGAPAVFVYDAYEGGMGLAEIAYQQAGDLLRLAHDTVTRCGCVAGCPACVQSGVCRKRNETLDKGSAIALLGALTAMLDGATPGALREAASGQPLVRSGPDPRALGRQRALHEIMEHARRRAVHERLEAQAAPGTSPAADGPAQLQVGDWVEQAPYGRGQVVALRQEGERQRAVIRFVQRGLLREVDASRLQPSPAGLGPERRTG